MVTIKDIKKLLGEQTNELKEFAVAQTAELSRITAGGFVEVIERLDQQDRAASILDERVELLGKKVEGIEKALYITIKD